MKDFNMDDYSALKGSMDQMAKRKEGIQYYIRYMDDAFWLLLRANWLHCLYTKVPS